MGLVTAPTSTGWESGGQGVSGNVGWSDSSKKKSTEIEEPVKADEGNGKSISTGEERVAKAKEYDMSMTYSKNREAGTTNCADFINLVMLQTDKDIAQYFISEPNTTYSNVEIMRNAILNSLGGEIRSDNPKVGDIAIWWNGSSGHVEFVASVFEKDGKTYFTTYGAGSGDVPKEMGISYKNEWCSKNGCPWLYIGYPKIGGLGQGGVFEGFWTPHLKKN